MLQDQNEPTTNKCNRCSALIDKQSDEGEEITQTNGQKEIKNIEEIIEKKKTFNVNEMSVAEVNEVVSKWSTKKESTIEEIESNEMEPVVDVELTTSDRVVDDVEEDLHNKLNANININPDEETKVKFKAIMHKNTMILSRLESLEKNELSLMKKIRS